MHNFIVVFEALQISKRFEEMDQGHTLTLTLPLTKVTPSLNKSKKRIYFLQRSERNYVIPQIMKNINKNYFNIRMRM